VRRNAVLCIYTIYKNYDFLMPDAPEVIQQFLMQEQVRNSIEQKLDPIFIELIVEELVSAVAHRPFTHPYLLRHCLAVHSRCADCQRRFKRNCVSHIFLQDISARRNAFMMLVYADRDRALDYLDTVMDQACFHGYTLPEYRTRKNRRELLVGTFCTDNENGRSHGFCACGTSVHLVRVTDRMVIV
jgi:hypothetical protein